ncbi:HAD family hydrolase [uncultured Tenacibaculum sp.]|uniref:HAD family hydrolase n=1 Tax=uncultured Tenacibaculum sp. TaxID=174713 RepID=UPI00261F5F2E|nr:HAD family hydrolase [uncultured Tenacibaculum sp.]
MKNLKTIVFDLYNTLIEIKEPRHFFLKLFKKSKDGFDLELSSYLRLVMTKNTEQLISVLPDEFKELYEENKDILKEELSSVVVYEEVYDVLNKLKEDFNIFLISNLATPYKEPFFEKELNKYFQEVIFSCDYGSIKPEKRIFKEIEKITGSNPNEILIIGDSLKSDICIPKKLGWSFIRVKRNGEIKESFDVVNLKDVINRVY